MRYISTSSSHNDLILSNLNINRKSNTKMIQTVVKRDGRIVGFNEQKIMAAIRKAMLHTDKGEDTTLIEQITDHISYRGKSQMSVEAIQDAIEKMPVMSMKPSSTFSERLPNGAIRAFAIITSSPLLVAAMASTKPPRKRMMVGSAKHAITP